MTRKSPKQAKRISAKEFDARFDRGEDMTKFLDLKHARLYRGLTKEERELSRSIERGEWRSVPNKDAEIRRIVRIARASLRKSRRRK